jgi:penicillin-binding protein 2
LEQQYDSILRGTPGTRYIEVDNRGRMVREEGAAPTLPPIAGRAIRTTIDLPLQEFIDSIWPVGVRGAVVAMTPQGQVLAMYSAPSFDPNDFIGGISGSRWRELTTDPARPLLNRAIQARYPPGSPFKLAMSVIALKKGIVTINSHMGIPCRGGLQFGNRYFRCWKREGHGSLDLLGAIAQSCDVYFYQLGLRVGLPTILEEGIRLGFEDRTGIDLAPRSPHLSVLHRVFRSPLRAPGLDQRDDPQLRDRTGGEYPERDRDDPVLPGLANGGVEVTPYIVERPSKQVVRNYGLTEGQALDLRRALIQVVVAGTASRSRQLEFQLAGKTGTAQNTSGKNHGWFLGFAPAEQPKIVIGMIMESLEGEHGGAMVAPYVGQIAGTSWSGPTACSRFRCGYWSPRTRRRVRSSSGRTAGPPVPSPEPAARPSGDAVDEGAHDRPDAGHHPAPADHLRRAEPLFRRADRRAYQAIGVWKRQLVWLVIGGIACYVMFRTSPRLLEWAAPWVYAFALLLLAVTLVIGTGQGLRPRPGAGSPFGGHQLGQPAELAKVAVVLMLARYLSSRREAPISMRELIVPCLIAGIPFLWC